jgi:hypothetical protein
MDLEPFHNTLHSTAILDRAASYFSASPVAPG